MAALLDQMLPTRSAKVFYSTESVADNETLVRRAILRRKRESFTISDLFNLFDPLDKYFKISIALACLMYTPNLFEYVIEAILDLPHDVSRFQDCNDITYGEIKKHELLNIARAAEVSKSFRRLQAISEVLSPLICLFFYRKSIRTNLLFFASIGVIKWICILSRGRYYISMSRVVTPITMAGYRIVLFRYIAASVPYNLIIFSFSCLLTSKYLIDIIGAIILQKSRNWSRAEYVTLAFYVISSIIFYFKAPTPILQSILDKDSPALQKLIREYTNIDNFDADGLIDDLLYRQEHSMRKGFVASISPYLAKAHLLRQLLYIMYSVAINLLTDIQISFLKRYITADFFGSILIESGCPVICLGIASFLLYRLKVRKTLWIAFLLTCIGLLLIGIRCERELVNICYQSMRPASFVHTKEYTPVLFAGLLCIILGTAIFEIANFQMIATFFPVQHQPILLPIHFFGCNLLYAFLDLVIYEEIKKDWRTERVMVCALLVVSMGILSAFVESENNWTVVTTGDVFKMKDISSKYPAYPEGDDDSYYDESDELKYSGQNETPDEASPKEKAVKMFHGVKRKRSTQRFSDTGATTATTCEDSPSTLTASPTPPTTTSTSPTTPLTKSPETPLKTDSTQDSTTPSSDLDCVSVSLTSSPADEGDNRYANSLKAVRERTSNE